MKHLVIFCSPGRSLKTERLYKSSLSELGDFDFVPISPNGFSRAHALKALSYLAVDSDGVRKIFPKLRKTHNLDSEYASVLLITFSAGYGFAREWFKYDGIDAVDTYCAIDSIHGTNALDNVQQFADFALKKKCFIEHTDVEPYKYASTTDVAVHLKKLVGDRLDVRHDKANGYSPKRQHIRAFTVYGPEYVKKVASYIVEKYGVGKEKVFKPDYSKSLPGRCLDLCRYEMTSKVRGIPIGSHSHPRIDAYFSGAIRLTEGPYKGKNLHLRAANWCAVSQGWVEMMCRKPGEKVTVPWTYSGLELENWSKARETWIPIKSIVGDLRVKVKPGDVCIMKRGTGWTRHVARVESVEKDSFTTIGGNEGDMWKRTKRTLHDTYRPVLGFISYPKAESKDPPLEKPTLPKETAEKNPEKASLENPVKPVDSNSNLEKKSDDNTSSNDCREKNQIINHIISFLKSLLRLS